MVLPGHDGVDGASAQESQQSGASKPSEKNRDKKGSCHPSVVSIMK